MGTRRTPRTGCLLISSILTWRTSGIYTASVCREQRRWRDTWYEAGWDGAGFDSGLAADLAGTVACAVSAAGFAAPVGLAAAGGADFAAGVDSATGFDSAAGFDSATGFDSTAGVDSVAGFGFSADLDLTVCAGDFGPATDFALAAFAGPLLALSAASFTTLATLPTPASNFGTEKWLR